MCPIYKLPPHLTPWKIGRSQANKSANFLDFFLTTSRRRGGVSSPEREDGTRVMALDRCNILLGSCCNKATKQVQIPKLMEICILELILQYHNFIDDPTTSLHLPNIRNLYHGTYYFFLFDFKEALGFCPIHLHLNEREPKDKML